MGRNSRTAFDLDNNLAGSIFTLSVSRNAYVGDKSPDIYIAVLYLYLYGGRDSGFYPADSIFQAAT